MNQQVKNIRPTIDDVAKACGVSTGTVSRVLNERPGVKARTRARVLRVIRELDYKPRQAARELSLKRNLRIGLNLPKGNRRLIPFFLVFFEHLMKAVQREGYWLEDIPTGDDGLPESLSGGMVLFGAHADDPRIPYLQARQVPFVLVGHYPGVRWVAPNDFDGGLQATRHLVRLGHRKILHLGGTLNHQAFFDRYSGYKSALEEAGLESHDAYLLDGETTTLGAYRAIRAAVERGVDFSAVFAATDELAVGTLSALEDSGLRVPHDVSVVGFDDLPEIGEGLTTVRQDIGQIAAEAVTLLKEALQDAPVRHAVLPVQLIARGTTAKRR